MHVIGRPATDDGPVAHLGRYRARDGSTGAAVGLDLDRPHAALIVGKRGTGKSYTLGVLAEAAARTAGIAPVVLDPMGVFTGLADTTDGEPALAQVISSPRVRACDLPPSAWPSLLGLDVDSAPGALVWQAAAEVDTLSGMHEWITDATAAQATRRAAANHLRLAAEWEVFSPDGLTPTELGGNEATVVDLSGLAPAPMTALARVLIRGLYDARLEDHPERLPWLFVDEAHTLLSVVADPAFRTVLTRGRAPGVSLVAATQRPSALPAVAWSQADLLLAHRLTTEVDVQALTAACPTVLRKRVRDRLPTTPGEVAVVDDATEEVHEIRVRERATPHGGASPRASDV